MSDLASTIAPKSDQLNADDLIAGPMTITVTGVSVSSSEQPVSIRFEGDGGKPYKPGKSMRRVLVAVWGKDGNAYSGHRMTLYRDESVMFAGVAVGGIRISHMTGLQREFSLALTTTRGQRKPYKVKPLRDGPARDQAADDDSARASKLEQLLGVARQKAALGFEVFEEWRAKLKPGQRDALTPIHDELHRLMHPDDETSDLDEDVPA